MAALKPLVAAMLKAGLASLLSPFAGAVEEGGGGGGISCAYTFDNTTAALFGKTPWPTFDAEAQSAGFTCDAGATAGHITIPTPDPGPALTGVVPLTGDEVYYFEIGFTLPETAPSGNILHLRAGIINSATFQTSSVRLDCSGASGKEIQWEPGGGTPSTLATLPDAAIVDYRVGVYVNATTGAVGVIGASDFGYSVETPFATAVGFAISLEGQQTTPDEVGDCSIKLYTSSADFQRTPPVGAYDICGNVI